jgi:phosphoribosyl 1,2-cyclic phosphodiesterase
MRAISLQSGSNGNCLWVEAEGVGLIIDAGISGVQAEKRLAAHGRSIGDAQGLVISHDHADHARSAGVFARKFKLTVHATRATLKAAVSHHKLGEISQVRPFAAGEILDFGPLAVETYSTPHDGADPVAFVVESRGVRLGVLTDLGHVFAGLSELVRTLDAVFIESNHDPAMLERGPYPGWLKRRISGPAGHLSNRDAAGLIAGPGAERLRWACLAHLSEQNNDPDLALETHREIYGDDLAVHVASRYEGSAPFYL